MSSIDIVTINNIIRRNLEEVLRQLEEAWWVAHLAVGDAAAKGASGPQIKALSKKEEQLHELIEALRKAL